ncbi:MAG: signal peptidase II [Pseudomonadota bacterium]
MNFQKAIAELKSSSVAWSETATANRFFFFGLLGAALIFVLDQMTKLWILYVIELPLQPGGRIEISSIFDLTYVENTGASFGMLAGSAGSRVILSIISTIVAVGLIIWLGAMRRRIAAAGAAFIIGGALGNLYDRVAYGYVVDFLDFSGLSFPWVFNVADASINIGVALLLLDAWLSREKQPSAGT